MNLSPEALEIRRQKVREYQKAWRKKNPEKAAIIEARYWENKAKKAREEAEKNK